MATGEVVPAGDGDGERTKTLRALEADGFDGFFSMEPHLAAAGTIGGFSSGPFTQATPGLQPTAGRPDVTYR